MDVADLTGKSVRLAGIAFGMTTRSHLFEVDPQVTFRDLWDWWGGKRAVSLDFFLDTAMHGG